MRSVHYFLLSAAGVLANPFPQGVTSIIPPSVSAPPGCKASYSGVFGVAVMSIQPTTASSGAVATQSADGQPGVGSSAPITTNPITLISDGQPQATTSPTAVNLITSISDHQIQAPTSATSVNLITSISDHQIQAPTSGTSVFLVSSISDHQIQAPTSAVSVMTMHPITQIHDGQIQAPYITVTVKSTIVSAVAVTSIPDHQPQGAVSTTLVTSVATSITIVPITASSVISSLAKLGASIPASVLSPSATASAVASMASTGTMTNSTSSSNTSSAASSPSIVACQTNNTLALLLNNTVLKDAQGRTGYIASNWQFQFDDPPQSGALFTSGFTVCANGTLALGGSAVWYQCLSGNFYNLYSVNWAPQCVEVTITTLALINCTNTPAMRRRSLF